MFKIIIKVDEFLMVALLYPGWRWVDWRLSLRFKKVMRTMRYKGRKSIQLAKLELVKCLD